MKNVAIFMAGLTIGSVVTYKLVEKRFKDLADEEIESVVETFKNRLEKETSKKKRGRKSNAEKTSEETKEEVVDYSKKVNDLGYSEENEESGELTTYTPSDEDCVVNVESTDDHIQIYQIDPTDFGEELNYGTKTYTYYSDGVLADEVENIVADTTLVMPDDLLNKFIADTEEDAIYVRDEDNEMDYEVLKESKTFSEINEGASY